MPITDEEWEELAENFDTAEILSAVDALDNMRDALSDKADGAPPQMRDDLLKLHRLAMGVVNSGACSQAGELFELAVELEDQVIDLMASLEEIRNVLSQLTAFSPESPVYDGFDDDDFD